MRILFNTAHQRFGGAVQVALSFINELKGIREHDFIVWLGPGLSPLIDKQSFPSNFQFESYDFGVIGLKVAKQINLTLQEAEKKYKPEVIISTSGPTYFKSVAPQIIGYNLGLYLYPESPYHKLVSLKSKIIFQIRKAVHFHYFKRDACALVVQTDDVNQRVRKALGINKVYTVSNTASNYFSNFKSNEPKIKENQGSFRFLTVSAYYLHKNLEIISKISQELKRRGLNNVEFILTLKDADYQQIAQGDPNIKTVGPIKPEECPSLYKDCQAMFLPTLAECFSASYPEAMIMERPIITTDLGFARSICGEAALFYKAMDPIAATDQIVKLINDQSLQENLISLGKKQLKNFDSPQQRALKYLKLCVEIGENKN